MPETTLRPVPQSEEPIFGQHFQDYLGDLSRLNGARPDRNGRFEYSFYDFYWQDERYKPFFIESDGQRAGLMMLRELPAHESPAGRESLQVAEIYVFRTFRQLGVGKAAMRAAARMAEERRMPLTWSAYINNGPANALYRSVLSELSAKEAGWAVDRSRGLDRSGLARFYYQLTPPGASAENA